MISKREASLLRTISCWASLVLKNMEDGFFAPSLALGSSYTSQKYEGISETGLEHPCCLSMELTLQPCGQVELHDGWIAGTELASLFLLK